MGICKCPILIVKVTAISSNFKDNSWCDSNTKRGKKNVQVLGFQSFRLFKTLVTALLFCCACFQMIIYQPRSSIHHRFIYRNRIEPNDRSSKAHPICLFAFVCLALEVDGGNRGIFEFPPKRILNVLSLSWLVERQVSTDASTISIAALMAPKKEMWP